VIAAVAWIGEQGLLLRGEAILDGKIHRAGHTCRGGPGDDAGWYSLKMEPVPHGAAGCWRCGHKASLDPSQTAALTEEQRRQLKARADERNAEIERRRVDVAEHLRKSLGQLPPAPASHAYLQRKGIATHGALLHPDGHLILPLEDAAGAVWSAQAISAESVPAWGGRAKSFEAGGRIAGCFYRLGRLDGAETIVVCEGFATAATIEEATGLPTLAAMSSGNIAAVVAAVTERFRDATLIVAADNDRASEKNDGLDKATAAARAYDTALAIPDFGDRPPSKTESDFNDLGRVFGSREVRLQVIASLTKAAGGSRGSGKHEVILPDDFGQEMPRFLDQIGEAFADVNRGARVPAYVQRGGVLGFVVGRGRRTRIQPASESAVRCEVQRHVSLLKRRKSRRGNGELEVLKAGEIPSPVARDVAISTAVSARLPEVLGLSTCPVIDRRGEVVADGYAPDLRLLVACDEWDLPALSVEDAARVLLEVVADFAFVSDADRSRALAAIIEPALVLGGHVARGPVMLVTADQRSTGKGTIVRMRAAIYGAQLAVIAARQGGVGSMDEDVSAQLIDAAPFIGIDNVRGRIASQILESALTEDAVTCRKPYRAPMAVETGKTLWSITSNGVSLTEDIASRICAVRLRKREAGYKFRTPDPYLWCVENRGRLLSAVFTLVRHWINSGCPRADNRWNDHHRDFWGVVDWIIPAAFRLPPPTQGAADAAQNASDPLLELFRVVGLELKRGGTTLPTRLAASAMLRLADEAGARFDGKPIPTGDHEMEGMAGSVGARGKRLFANRESVQVEEFAVRRVTTDTARQDGGGYLSVAYEFSIPDPAPQWVQWVGGNSLEKGHSPESLVVPTAPTAPTPPPPPPTPATTHPGTTPAKPGLTRDEAVGVARDWVRQERLGAAEREKGLAILDPHRSGDPEVEDLWQQLNRRTPEPATRYETGRRGHR
jgi:phage/plasmid primase-like uncharacterized protein